MHKNLQRFKHVQWQLLQQNTIDTIEARNILRTLSWIILYIKCNKLTFSTLQCCYVTVLILFVLFLIKTKQVVTCHLLQNVSKKKINLPLVNSHIACRTANPWKIFKEIKINNPLSLNHFAKYVAQNYDFSNVINLFSRFRDFFQNISLKH